MRTMFDIAPPNDPSGREFEEMCLVVYSHRYQTRDAMYYNRGHGQHGIDIKLHERPLYGRPRNIVVQCKDVEKLPPSAIGPNLEEALTHWRPTSETDADLLVIVATTALRPNTGKITRAFKDIRDRLVSASLRYKTDILVHGWDDIKALIQFNPELEDHFRANGQYDVPDENIRVGNLANSIQRCVAEGRLNEARQHWQIARSLENNDALPRTLLRAAVSLFLTAGDFAKLGDMLDRSLSRRTVNASALVAYFRAKRFTSKVPEHAVNIVDMVKKDLPPFSIDGMVDEHEVYLLGAHGSFDDKLTLALWMVVYGGVKTASGGLLRAFSLVRQHWPVPFAMPGPGEEWTIIHGRLAPQAQAYRAMHYQPVIDQERVAVVLTHAYEFLRSLHATRFGWPATLHEEAAVEGWTIFYPNPRTLERPDALDYFGFNGACRPEFDAIAQFKTAGLTGFYAEATRMTAEWEIVAQMRERTSAERLPYGVVCTSQVLLADAETGQGHRRRKEVILKVPALAVERVLAVMRMLEIADAAERRLGISNNVHAWRLSRLQGMLREMTRKEEIPIPDGRISIRATYTNQPQLRDRIDISDELRAAIAMSSDLYPLLVTFKDTERAREGGANEVRIYWLWEDEWPRHEGNPGSQWYQAYGTGYWAPPRIAIAPPG